MVATSVKGDLVRDTIGWRSHLGDVHVYDPSGTTTYHRSGWSPLAGCTTWAGAGRAAYDLAMAGAAVGMGMNLADFWFGGAAKALALPVRRGLGPHHRRRRPLDRPRERDDLNACCQADAALAYQATA